MFNCYLTDRRINHFLLLLLVFSCCFGVACKEDPVKAKKRYLEKGKKYLEEKKYAEAKLEFRNALTFDKKNVEALFGLAESDAGTNNFQEAFEIYRAVIDLDPKNIEAKARLGNIYLQFVRDASSVTEAEKYAREVLEADPNHIEGHILRAGVFTSKQKWAEAEQDLKKAIELNPKRPESLLSYAKFFQERAKRDTDATKFTADAERVYQQVLQLDPKFTLGYIAYADFLYGIQRFDETEAQLKKAVESNPKDRNALASISRFYETRKNFPEAEKYLSMLAEVSGDKNASRAQIIDLHARDGKIDQAINEYQELLKQSPKYLHAYVQIANLYLQKDDRAAALQQVEAGLKQSKQDTELLLVRGKIHSLNGRLRDAFTDLEQALKQDPRNMMGLYSMTQARLQDGDSEKARTYNNELLRYYPSSPAGILMRGNISLSQEKPDIADATKAAEKVIEMVSYLKSNAAALQSSGVEPEVLPDLEGKGYTLRGLAKIASRDMAGAQADFERAVQTDPRNPESQGNLAGIFLVKNDLAKARQSADQVLGMSPVLEQSVTKAVSVLLAQKDFAPGLQKLDALIASHPTKKAFLLDQKVRIYSAQGDAANTDAALRQIMQADPNYANAYFEKFALYKSQNQPDQALNELQQLVTRRPDNPRQMAQALLLIAMVEEEKGRYDEAIKNYEKAIGYDNRSAVASIALNNLAWLIADKGKGNLDKAAEHARKAIEISPAIASYYDTFGYVLNKKKIQNLAIPQLQKAIQMRPNDPSFYRHLAQAYRDKGDRTSAIQNFEKALSLGGSKYADSDAVTAELNRLR
jgi:cellulose synthase operon protein C